MTPVCPCTHIVGRYVALAVAIVMATALLVTRWPNAKEWAVMSVGTLVLGGLMILRQRRATPYTSIVELCFYGTVAMLAIFSSFGIYDNARLLFGIGLSIGTFTIVKYSVRRATVALLFGALVVTSGVESLYGMLYAHSSLGVVGHFNNPSGFAATLAAILPMGLYFSLGSRCRLIRITALTLTVTIATAIVLSKSRAGILAAIIIVIIFAIYHAWPYIRLVSPRLRLVYMSLGATLLMVGFVSMYYAKKESADGRRLIWQSSLAMISERPVSGYGTNSFQAKYMLYQADYLRKHTASRLGALADNVRHPFNEYLSLMIQYGIGGFLLLCMPFVAIIRQVAKGAVMSLSLQKLTLLCSLLAIMVVSLFSYPFSYTTIIIIMSADVAMLALYVGSRISVKRRLVVSYRLLYILLVVALTVSAQSRIGAEAQLSQISGRAITATTLTEYSTLDQPPMSTDPALLYNYGAALNALGRYAESSAILDRCSAYCLDLDVAILQTDNHYRMGNNIEAEKWVDQATWMCPNRFVPLYYKVMILARTGRMPQALKLAREVIVKDVKIDAGDVYKVKFKLQSFIDHNGDE